MKNDNLPSLIKNSSQIECYQEFKDNTDGIASFSVNKQRTNQLATASFDRTIKIYDIDSMKLIHNLTEHNKGVWQCDYSSTYSHFVSAGNDNQIILWDSTNYKVLNATTFHQDVIYDVKFSTNGNLIASCSKGVACIWDVKRMSQPLTVIETGKNQYLTSINFINGDRSVTIGTRNGEIYVQDINDIKNLKRFPTPKNDSVLGAPTEILINAENVVYCINKFKNKIHKDNEIMTSHEDGTVRIWQYDKDELKMTKDFFYFNYPSTCVNSSYDDQYLISSSKDHSALVWQFKEDDKLEWSLVGHSDVVTCADFISNDVVATTSYDSTLRLWKLS